MAKTTVIRVPPLSKENVVVVQHCLTFSSKLRSATMGLNKLLQIIISGLTIIGMLHARFPSSKNLSVPTFSIECDLSRLPHMALCSLYIDEHLTFDKYWHVMI